MRYTLPRKLFKDTLASLVSILENRNHLPILNYIVLQVSHDGVYAIATNLEQSLKIRIDGGTVEEEGSLTLPAHLLFKYLSLSTADNCLLVTEEDTSGVKITLGKEKLQLALLPVADFPIAAFDSAEEVQTRVVVQPGEFATALRKTAFACSSDMTRPALMGVSLLLQEGLLRVAATDTYRLAEQKLPLDYSGADKQVIIPKKASDHIAALVSLGTDLQITLTENRLFLSLDSGRVQYTTRLIEGKFPPYLQILPASYSLEVLCSTPDVQVTLRKIALFADEDHNSFVKMTPNDTAIDFDALQTQVGTTSDSLLFEMINGSSENIALSVNARYFLDIVQTVQTERLVFHFQEGMKPMMVTEEKNDDFLALLMPIRK